MKIENINILKNGGIGIVLTDTIFGIVGRALNKDAVERIYKVKGRDKNKPFIILISQYSDLSLFNIKVDDNLKKILQKYWPEKVSIILSCLDKNFTYLHRGTNSLAFRFPKNKRLIKIIKETGPLVAPSANPQGENPAKSAREAKKYFDQKIDFYQNGRMKDNKPSTLIKITENKVEILRK